jgi:thioredoxin 1
MTTPTPPPTQPTNVVNLNVAADFTNAISQNSMALIEFYAEWCSACAEAESYYPEMSISYPTVKMFRLNIQNVLFNAILKTWNITNFPTFLYFDNGTIFYTQIGANKLQSIFFTQQLIAANAKSTKDKVADKVAK